MNKGKIEVICGPMFSGKSEELLRRLKRASIAKRPFQLFKPATDTRYSENEVVSHSGQKLECTPTSNPYDIIQNIKKGTTIVAIDEAQFFDDSIVTVALQLTELGIRVITAGLDMDSRGTPFGSMPQLLAVAEDVTKLTAVCEACGEAATHSYRRDGCGTSQVLLGEKETYEARCREHWSPA